VTERDLVFIDEIGSKGPSAPITAHLAALGTKKGDVYSRQKVRLRGATATPGTCQHSVTRGRVVSRRSA
jgi:hypothetical protein